MLKKVDAILWQKIRKADLDTLRGVSSGQYHIAIPDRNFQEFFKGLDERDPTSKGGFTILVRIEAYEGTEPVPAVILKIRYMGKDSARSDWNIPSQRPDSAYPLWRVGRGATKQGSAGLDEYLVIVRDSLNCFHARWINDQVFLRLPDRIKTILKSDSTGWGSV